MLSLLTIVIKCGHIWSHMSQLVTWTGSWLILNYTCNFIWWAWTTAKSDHFSMQHSNTNQDKQSQLRTEISSKVCWETRSARAGNRRDGVTQHKIHFSWSLIAVAVVRVRLITCTAESCPFVWGGVVLSVLSHSVKNLGTLCPWPPSSVWKPIHPLKRADRWSNNAMQRVEVSQCYEQIRW